MINLETIYKKAGHRVKKYTFDFVIYAKIYSNVFFIGIKVK